MSLASESGEHGTDSRLSHDDGLIVHRSCDQHGEEGRQRQSPHSATGELHHQLSDRDADDYPDQQPDSARPSASQDDVETTMAAIGAKTGSVCPTNRAAITHAVYSRGGLLRNWPDRVRPSATHSFYHPLHPLVDPPNRGLSAYVPVEGSVRPRPAVPNTPDLTRPF